MNYIWNLLKTYSGHLHHDHIISAKYHDPSPNGYPDILFTISRLIAKMLKSEMEHNSVKYSQNFTKS